MATQRRNIWKYVTTPKPLDGQTWEKYVDAFVAGLREGNVSHITRKLARGLLSIDRTIHSEQDGYQIIDKVVSEKQAHGMLIGIDICGDFLAPRSLTGGVLVNVLNYALEKPIGIAIHIGEADTSIERQDVDSILDTLSAWYDRQGSKNPNPLHGKVRLGHGIFLTQTQCERIKKLQIPVEVCPTCHEKSNWWLIQDPHPVQKNIYSYWSDPVVSGTDDATIFGGDAKQDSRLVLEIFSYPEDQEKGTAYRHQSQFRFN